MTEDHSSTTGETELLVVGAGPAGYVAAIRAAQLGVDVTLVERSGFGGTCLNHGCIPSKALIHAAEVAHEARTAHEIGVHADVSVEFGEIRRWKDRVVRRLTRGIELLCERNGVALVEGEATFEDEGTVAVRDGSDERRIGFERAVVATGSRPIELPGFAYGDGPILDARRALELEELPERLLVVGAGYIGMELSTAFAKLGARVTVVEALDGILPGYDDDLVEPVYRTAADLGIDFAFDHVAADWTETADGVATVELEPTGDRPDAGDDRLESVTADAVLVAVGREPVTDSLELENAGVDVDSNGFVETNDRLETSNERIFAVGDAAGEPLLAHAASEEGKRVAESVAAESSTGRAGVPAVVFTDPEIATVGLTADAAEAEGYDPVVGRFPLRANGRALTANASEGFVSLVADEPSGRVLGGQVVGREASELIATVSVAVANDLTVDDIVGTIQAHPTLAEAVEEAALDATGDAIHTY
ncbi:dihydrolipoyl dehydrogenase [Natrarchaeobius oligotrophus]|uniref:Dihydrolipoyl dehydrogenase n=1 Tax=Natrarchaeobius chitinivorans TaxID=1679083 RepID=A0A3N6MVN7_NATCH|nr:dihydrolipoyl dehydrogenase [Natrarchaeobius chitinivorans]RQG98986.1 dihydrolipoyl dehydrogenase [Natrarchaeobius chitinivorans]